MTAEMKADHDEFDDDFNKLMDATQTLIQLEPGDVLTEEMIADLHLVDADHRESFERATDAFHKGYEAGLERGAGADTAKLIEERDDARSEAMIAKALNKALVERSEARTPAPSSTGDVERDSIIAAYKQGALDVHNQWMKHDEWCGDGTFPDPDFTEAAHDYADAAIAALQSQPSSGDGK